MADALRHARLLHYLLIVISLCAVPVVMHTNALVATYAGARVELEVLTAFLGRIPAGTSSSELGIDTERMEQARNLITTRVHEHVHRFLSRSLQMGMGGELDDVEIGWEVPIAHESQLPLGADLLQIRSHFAAIPILVLQPDITAFAWMLTSRMSAAELREIRSLTIHLQPMGALEQYVARSGFNASDEGLACEIELGYSTASGETKRIQSTQRGRVVRPPDLNLRAEFRATFPELERVFPYVEFQTPEQADVILAERERNARGGVLPSLALERPLRLTLLIGIPLFMLLLLSHVRHVAGLLTGSNARALQEFTWFPLLSDSNSRAFGILSLMILPGAAAAGWVAQHLATSAPTPLEDVLLYSAGFAAPAWIGFTILRELDELRVAGAEAGREASPPPEASDDA